MTGEIGNGNTLLRAKDTGKEETTVRLEVEDPVNLSFSARYLNLFSKASTVASQVVLSMSTDRPLLLEYKLPKGLGELKFYLAPKINDEEWYIWVNVVLIMHELIDLVNADELTREGKFQVNWSKIIIRI